MCSDCIKELEQECFIPIKAVDSWRVCVECTWKDSTHLELGLPGAHAVEAAAVDPEIESAVSKRVKANDGLGPFLLHHKAGNGDAMKGFDLFVKHVVEKRNLRAKSLSPSEHLDVQILSSTMGKFFKPVLIQTFMVRDSSMMMMSVERAPR